MSLAIPPLPGNSLVLSFLDGSLRAWTAEFALLIALEERGVGRGSVTVTLERQNGHCPPVQWEFPIRPHGLKVVVGEADVTGDEAPLLRMPPGGPICPAEIDDVFTRSFRLFCLINKERLALLAMDMRPRAIWMVRA